LISSLPIRESFWGFLLPLSLLWAALAAFRRRWLPVFFPGYRSRLPTVCIGNLHAGGTGKTPLVALLANELKSWSPILLSRGYGGTTSKQGAWVNPEEPGAWKKYGDEPVYLARATGCPVRVGANRRQSAKAVESAYHTGFLLMDDGFQNLQLQHDLDIVVLPEAGTWAEQFCHPLGPLRESAGRLRYADAAVVMSGRIGADQVFRWRSYLQEFFPKLPLFEVRPSWGGLYRGETPFIPQGGEKFGAFCGIARPSRFFEALHAHLPPGAILLNHPFGDHHPFTDSDVLRLKSEGQLVGVTHWITTEKDLIRMDPVKLGGVILTARVEYDIPEGLVAFIQERLEKI
jgi:tetraacyldisaccharide 4'-kinase